MLAVNYGITLSIVGLLVEVVKLSPYIGVIASTAATASTSFFVMKYFVFKS
jgi:putative flippase GtrA